KGSVVIVGRIILSGRK
nr:Chain C, NONSTRUCTURAL PROTEIN NS4A (P4) [Hepatitis C virus (isolate Taiwan)]1DXP_D Chain D, NONSTRUCTURAL PROTEIN NS4A (P4) [Hepatitis C virus (isolate Taiwan)]1DY8_C Chain C, NONSTRUCTURAL PROTEIN NS4A (P4) [Hepatitis C virus (isolate Taiwan)]1DY8_D Chain D, NONSTRUCTURAL PROTEIN NS4A (P4) [Hepatitis C virus (isolate Taiwan)]1DY9_C Chain C, NONSTRUCTURAL PROTEIN NS4A (P4) [Hepatitis C virus (isolate Taiwan)]1DY9_D Chain D, NONSTRUCTURAL PROTEIN NS4A (P4) [Hepatitis C virus (isolate Taiwan